MADGSAKLNEALAIHGGHPLRNKPFGPRWVFDTSDEEQLLAVMQRSHVAWRNGEKIQEFVSLFQKEFGVRNAVACGSGTAAIHAAFGALNFDPGDEVITTSATDMGTVIGLLQHNLVPVFADWSPNEFNTDPADIERRITDRTRAILVVHLFGFPCDMDAILDIAARHGLAVVEDCAQAHLSEFKGQKVGTFGDLACWSFGLKTLTTNQGGMVSANDPELAAAARGFLSKGSVRLNDEWVPYSRLGIFAPMTDLQAAIGVAQIDRLEDATARRERTASAMDEAFSEIPCVRLPHKRTGDRNVYYMYPYELDQVSSGVSIEAFIAALRAEGISDAFGPYLKGKALHRHGLFQDAKTYGSSGFPFKDDAGVARVDYRSLKLPTIDTTLPGLGFFHMRNSFEEQDGIDIAAAITKVARGLGLMNVTISAAKNSQAVATVPIKTAHVTEQDREAEDTKKAPALAPVLASRPHPNTSDTANATPANSPDVDDKAEAIRSANLKTGADNALQNHATLQGLIDQLGDQGGVIQLPSGKFYIGAPLELVRRRNLVFKGAGGNSIDGGTRLYLQGDDEHCGLDLRTAIHCRFQDIEFVGSEDCRGSVVALGCDEGGKDGTSTLSTSFQSCTFRGPAQSTGVLLRNCALISFVDCWFKGCGVSAQIGVKQSKTSKSISNGLANSISFERCMLFEPVQGIRGSGIKFSSCQFSGATVNKGAGVDFGKSKHSEVLNVEIANCFAIEASGGIFFRQGPKGAGLIFSNNRIAGYRTAIVLNGLGAAVIQANVFDRKSNQRTIKSIETATFDMKNNIERD